VESYDKDDLFHIVSLLKAAIMHIEMDRPRAAAWRVADAGLHLREVLGEDVRTIGLTVATGQGAILPRRSDEVGQ